ncbi:MAG: threonine--tRNA ligase [Candidatus Omnitrophica bacterium]|nr:threonine--tRNA ligase [Candidatus Omnitrophota bacterium]MDD5488324.1 threonine--tRNA ligase [Candidatus Omnitrophota bacterium]
MSEKEGRLEKIRHSAAHIMADAVKKLYPGVKLGIGPSISDGFYYDFDFSGCAKNGDNGKDGNMLSLEALPAIEKEMERIIKADLPFSREEIGKEKAVDLFKAEGEIYKLEIIDGLGDEKITLFRHGDFADLCRGPHVGTTGEVKAFKLLSVAGAYWKGSEENPMLQRIYGTAFETKEELDRYLEVREEAQKRDHRKLGKELDLFSFNDVMGAGLVLYHPKGAMLRQTIVDYITRQHIRRGYELIYSPHVLKSDIWVKSGHYDYYKENMYIFDIEGQEFAVKPMNCPGHILVYSSRMRSYKELPKRYFELGNVYRHEKSGVLHGLLRVRGFTQDDAHIFCLKEQVEDEVLKVIDFVEDTLKVFGFSEFEVELSTRPEKSIGTDEGWEEATKALTNALEKKGLKYDINEGDGAFYGPKIDIKLKDALGRAWQCATIQCDFALPERFDLKYVDNDGSEKRPIMLHRVILGSLERFMGAVIEHYGGEFPVWLAPVQAKLIPISDAHVEYASELGAQLIDNGFRVEIDSRNEKMQRKIRDAELAKVPYMAILGNKEMQNGTVSVRSKKEGDLGVMSKEDFLGLLSAKTRDKA